MCCLMIRRPPRSTRTDTLFPYTTLFRSRAKFRRPPNSSKRQIIEPGKGGGGPDCERGQMRRIKLRKSRRQSGRTLILHDARNDLVLITADTVIDHAAILDAHRDRIISEERRVGKECVSTCRSRWWPYH